MRTLKGPAIFLAQFAGDKAPFDTLDNICEWAAGLGYKGIQTHYNAVDAQKLKALSDTMGFDVVGVHAGLVPLIDELGAVIDFIHYQIPGIISNVSNLADHAIVIGVILIVIQSWRADAAKAAEPEAQDESGG